MSVKRDFRKYDKSHDHFFYSSTYDYREDVSDDEANTSVAPRVRPMVFIYSRAVVYKRNCT